MADNRVVAGAMRQLPRDSIASMSPSLTIADVERIAALAHSS